MRNPMVAASPTANVAVGRRGPKFWTTMRQEYVTSETGVTLEKLAIAHGVRPVTVRRRSAAEDWPQQQAQFWHKTYTDVMERIGRKIVLQRERNFDRLTGAAVKLSTAIASGEVTAKSVEAAANALANVVRAMEAMTLAVEEDAGPLSDPPGRNLLFEHMTPEALLYMLQREALGGGARARVTAEQTASVKALPAADRDP